MLLMLVTSPRANTAFGSIISMLNSGDLDVWVKSPRIASKIEKLWKAKSHYDDGALVTSFIRPYSDLDLAARFIKAAKRRIISPEQRKKLVEIGRTGRFRKSNTAQNDIPATDSLDTTKKTVPERPGGLNV